MRGNAEDRRLYCVDDPQRLSIAGLVCRIHLFIAESGGKIRPTCRSARKTVPTTVAAILDRKQFSFLPLPPTSGEPNTNKN